MVNSKIVAEIEKTINESTPSHDQQCPWKDGYYCGLYKAEGIIDTIEVKKMNEESVNDDLEEAIGQSFIYHERRGNDFRGDKQIETAYKYGFETGVKWANEHSIEVKEVDLNKEIKDYFNNQPIITRSKGVDYRLIPSGEEIAKHFFELGLKAQKRE